MRAVKHWRRLPSKAVESPSLETSEMWPDKALSNHIKLYKLVPTLKLSWLDVMGYRASLQHKLFCSVTLCRSLHPLSGSALPCCRALPGLSSTAKGIRGCD